MNKKGLVSVIIPTYNTEKYVEQCLQSVLNQTYKNLEIIIVDNYSTDKTLNLVKEITQNDGRVKIFELTKNVGAGAARNVGLNAITGEYLYFIDSDDFIDLDYIENMVQSIENNDVDIVSNYNIVRYNWKNNDEQFWWNKKLKNGVLKLNSSNMYSIPIMLWCTLYKTSFIKENNIKFPAKNVPYEDFYFNSIAFSYANIVYINNKSSYYYRFRKGSTTGLNNKKENRFELIEVTRLLYDYFRDHNLLDKRQLNFLELKGRLNKHRNKSKFYKEIRSLFLEINDGIVCNTDSWMTENVEFFNNILKYKNYISYRLYNNEYKTLFDIKLFCIFSIFKFSTDNSNKEKISIFSIPFLKIIKKDKKTYIKLFGFISLLKIKNS